LSVFEGAGPIFSLPSVISFACMSRKETKESEKTRLEQREMWAPALRT